MTALRADLQGWRAPPLFQQIPRPVNIQRTRKEAERLLTNIEPKPPSSADMERVWRAAKRSMDEGRALTDVSKRMLAVIPWVMFEGFAEQSPLADDEVFLKAFCRRVEAVGSGRSVVTTVLAFLQGYPRESPTFDEWRLATSRLLSHCVRPRCRRLSDCAARAGFFRRNGPEMLWKLLEGEARPPEEVLNELCLTGTRARLGFVQAAFLVATARVRASLERGKLREAELQRLFAFALDPEVRPARLRFDSPAYLRPLAEGLLLPFARGKPAPSLKQPIQEFLLRHFGDPRLEPGRWHYVSEEAHSVILGWLVEETLEDFFRLLEYNARTDEVAQRHWRYRKAFWTAYLRAGVIRQAWVVLGPHVSKAALRRMGIQRDSYGRLKSGPGVQSNHAVLILRIGPLAITEWSHNGKYRIWNEGGAKVRKAPRPYRTTYTRKELIDSPDREGVHHGAERGRWQGKLARYIADATGIRLSYQDYMPHD